MVTLQYLGLSGGPQKGAEAIFSHSLHNFRPPLVAFLIVLCLLEIWKLATARDRMSGGRLDSLELLRNTAGICLVSNSCAGLKQLPKLGQEGIFFWFGLAVLHS